MIVYLEVEHNKGSHVAFSSQLAAQNMKHNKNFKYITFIHAFLIVLSIFMFNFKCLFFWKANCSTVSIYITTKQRQTDFRLSTDRRLQSVYIQALGDEARNWECGFVKAQAKKNELIKMISKSACQLLVSFCI